MIIPSCAFDHVQGTPPQTPPTKSPSLPYVDSLMGTLDQIAHRLVEKGTLHCTVAS